MPYSLCFGIFSGSSRKVREWDRKKPNESEEEMMIPIPISETFGNFDLVVKTFKFTSTDREKRMSYQSLNSFFFQITSISVICKQFAHSCVPVITCTTKNPLE